MLVNEIKGKQYKQTLQTFDKLAAQIPRSIPQLLKFALKRLKTRIVRVPSLKAEKEPSGRENRQKRLQNTGFDASGRIDTIGFIVAKECGGGSSYVFHAVALVISGSPRVPIISAERILASKSQVKQFQRFRGEGTLSKHHILQTLLHRSLLPVKMKVIKSLVVSLFSFLFFFFFCLIEQYAVSEIFWDYMLICSPLWTSLS